MNQMVGPRPAVFRLQATTQSPDLEQRSEIKYPMAVADLPKLRRLLEHRCRQQIHAREVSTVRSIYFDDLRLSACHANLSGLTERHKVRIRWYDRPLPGRDFFLEIKWRRNRRTGKHRQRILSHGPLADLPYREIQQQLIQHLPDQYVRWVLRYDQPTVLVQYRREHFVSDDGLVRLTIDYDLKFYDQTGKPSISLRHPIALPDLVVLEGKLAWGEEHRLKPLLASFRNRMGRCSKYVKACHALGWISES